MSFLSGGGMMGGGSSASGGSSPMMNPMQGIHQMLAPLGQMLGMPDPYGAQQEQAPAGQLPAPSATPTNNNTSAPVSVQGLDERALIELLAQADKGY